MAIQDGCVQLTDGDMDYVSFGSGEKNLIVLPGLSDGLASVKGKALFLKKPYQPFLERYRVSMFSRRNDLPSGFSIRNMAEDQAEAMKGLGIRKASVLGVSQGGMIAQYLAIDHPDLVDRLVLAVTANQANRLVRTCISRWIELSKAGNHKDLMIDTVESIYSEERLKKYRKVYPLLGRVGKPRSYDRFLANAEAILAFDASKELGRISAKTLILGGAEDQIVGAEASRELAEGIRGAELFVYPGLGHGAYEEAGDFYPRIFAFLER